MKFLTEKMFFFLIVQGFGGYAQINKDTIFQLEEIVIEVNRLRNFTTGNKIQKIDSAIIQNFNSGNLSDILIQHSQVFIKSYGLGNLATTSIRGAGASHTAILWNGFNLQGPTLGQADLSLVPATFLDDVQIQYGGAGALFGSGAVGGIIHLNTPAQFDKGISASISNSNGSFRNNHQAINLKISKKKFISSLRFFNHTAKNNYPFINTAQFGNPKVRQQNSEVVQFGVLQENYLKINKNQQVNVRIWMQENDRQIPLSMTSTLSLASIKNNFHRLSSEWKKIGERVNYFIRTAYFSEKLNYKDPVSDLVSITHYQTSITEFESKINIRKNQLLNIGINNTYSQALSDGFLFKPKQNRNAFFASYKLQNSIDTWKGLVSIRQELVEEDLVPFTPSLGFEGLIMKGIIFKGNASKNYRVPTFNDLYWYPGGNSDLKPESGWSEEIGITANSKYKDFSSELNFTVFNSNIDNWIIWIPNSNYWSPQNIQSVWSRGLESSLKIRKEFNQIKIELSLFYSYVVSTNEKTKSVNDQSLNKQLIYVPIYSAQSNFSASYKNFYLSYVHTYTGNRFTSTDNTEFIEGYQLGNLIFSKNFLTDKVRFNLNAQINNVWNKAYQAMLWQAMPLRYYQLGVSIFFNKSNNNS